MILDAIVSIFSSVFSPLFSVLPTWSLTSLSGYSAVTSAGSTVGSYLGYLNAWFPVSEMIDALTLICTVLLPAILLYKSVNWVWHHWPALLGGA